MPRKQPIGILGTAITRAALTHPERLTPDQEAALVRALEDGGCTVTRLDGFRVACIVEKDGRSITMGPFPPGDGQRQRALALAAQVIHEEGTWGVYP